MVGDDFVRNCWIIPRDEYDEVIVAGDDGIHCRMDGYAIIPLEEYSNYLKYIEKTINRKTVH